MNTLEVLKIRIELCNSILDDLDSLSTQTLNNSEINGIAKCRLYINERLRHMYKSKDLIIVKGDNKYEKDN